MKKVALGVFDHHLTLKNLKVNQTYEQNSILEFMDYQANAIKMKAL